MYRVVLSDKAVRFYDCAPAHLIARLDRTWAILAADPRRHPNIKALRGQHAGRLRIRLGEYRVIYRIDDTLRVVNVMAIGHRKDIY